MRDETFHGPSLLARSIKQKFQTEVWNFTVKPKETRLLSFLIQFVGIVKFRKETSELIVEKRYLFFIFQFLALLTKFLSAKGTKFARFCKSNARGRLLGDYGPLINQSERAYYRGHIIKYLLLTEFKGRTAN